MLRSSARQFQITDARNAADLVLRLIEQVVFLVHPIAAGILRLRIAVPDLAAVIHDLDPAVLLVFRSDQAGSGIGLEADTSRQRRERRRKVVAVSGPVFQGVALSTIQPSFPWAAL